jgi:uncharacterized protein YfaP (DUF2135 family)
MTRLDPRLSVVLSLVLALAPACKNSKGGDGGTAAGGTTTNVSTYVSGITAAGSSSSAAQSGTLPSATGGPTATVAANGNVVNGGSTQTTVTSASSFTKVLVAASNTVVTTTPAGAIAAAPDITGFYEIVYPSPTQSAVLVTSVPQGLTDTSFNFVYVLVDANGLVGSPSNVATTLITVGTGDVQVSLSWDTATDVDLHVVDPSSNEIYYGNKTVASNGTLDLDSNPGCSLDNKNNENVTWPSGAAPNGTYVVRVDYYSACSVSGSTKYTVTVNAGGTSKTFTGTFTASQADGGGSGSGTTIATFTKSASGVAFVAPRPNTAPVQRGVK